MGTFSSIFECRYLFVLCLYISIYSIFECWYLFVLRLNVGIPLFYVCLNACISLFSLYHSITNTSSEYTFLSSNRYVWRPAQFTPAVEFNARLWIKGMRQYGTALQCNPSKSKANLNNVKLDYYPNQTHRISVKTSRSLMFKKSTLLILKTKQNESIHSVGRMSSYWSLKRVAHRYTVIIALNELNNHTLIHIKNPKCETADYITLILEFKIAGMCCELVRVRLSRQCVWRFLPSEMSCATLCSLVDGYQHSGGASCLHLQSSRVKRVAGDPSETLVPI
jgi:hypothetical protein